MMKSLSNRKLISQNILIKRERISYKNRTKKKTKNKNEKKQDTESQKQKLYNWSIVLTADSQKRYSETIEAERSKKTAKDH
jgi:hypothetical protein